MPSSGSVTPASVVSDLAFDYGIAAAAASGIIIVLSLLIHCFCGGQRANSLFRFTDRVFALHHRSTTGKLSPNSELSSVASSA